MTGQSGRESHPIKDYNAGSKWGWQESCFSRRCMPPSRIAVLIGRSQAPHPGTSHRPRAPHKFG